MPRSRPLTRLLCPLFAATAALAAPQAPRPGAPPEGASPQRRIAVPGSPVQVLHWSERGPDGAPADRYRVSFDGLRFGRTRPARYGLELVRARFDPLQAAPDAARAPLGDTRGLFVVQYWTQGLAAYHRAIEALGGRVHQFLPYQANLVQLEPGQVDGVRALPFVRWVGPYLPDWRVEAGLAERLLGGALGEDTRVVVQVLAPEQKAPLVARLRGRGARVLAAPPHGPLLEVELGPALLGELATWDAVLWVEPWQARGSDMDLVRVDGGADALEAQLGFTGQGVRGEVFDGNVDDTHPALQSDPVLFHGLHAGDASHGTPVTGIVFGDGTGAPSARGLLPDGQPLFADHGQVTDRYQHTGELVAAPWNAVFQVAAWGTGLTRDYTAASMALDAIAFDFDLLLVQSQSNTGTQDSRPEAWSKNVLAVGGVRHQNTLDEGDDAWNGAGSIGPAADGRVKPDLAHWFDAVHCLADGGKTAQFGGSSAATAVTAGHAGLFFQMWHEGVFGHDPGGATVFDSRPHAATARAFLINGARRWDFKGAGHDLTRTHQGWGRASVAGLLERRARLFWVDEERPLANLDSAAYSLVVPPEEGDLSVTLVYADPPGTTAASVHRINDLTLRVSGPGGAPVYWGNHGLGQGNVSLPGGAPDDRNVVENVFVERPAPGEWLVEVLADEVNQDAHLETAAVDADFALVAAGTLGLVGECHDPAPYCAGAPNSVGPGAVLTGLGSTSIAADDLRLAALGLPPVQPALLLVGDAAQSTPLGNGTLCVGGATVRLDSGVADSLGRLVLDLDLAGLPPGAAIGPGDVSYFQLWYRDPAGGGAGYNLSNALQIAWCR